ncbi:MAG: M20/M25/M40 family metallo-hydrolase, partial [Bacteroidales bacterium]|nr:M20/M25/M40 family metallo-hydrolase [Bacteroidales bacterium]
MKNYIKENSDRFLSELFELLRIPSVSSMAEHNSDMQKAAEKYVQLLLAAGADKASVYKTKGHPVVFGEKILDKSLPTILVYAHYDVQPADPIEKWTTPPFEPQIRDGAIYARGANDDKGQGFMHVKALEYLIKTNQLKCNVKF